MRWVAMSFLFSKHLAEGNCESLEACLSAAVFMAELSVDGRGMWRSPDGDRVWVEVDHPVANHGERIYPVMYLGPIKQAASVR